MKHSFDNFLVSFPNFYCFTHNDTQKTTDSLLQDSLN